MAENKSEDPKDAKPPKPAKRKPKGRSVEERRMSDLLRVLEWLERRRRREKEALQKHKVVVPPKAPVKEEKKAQNTWKQPRRKQQVSFSDQASGPTARKDRDVVMYRRLYGVEAKGRRLSMVPGSYIKDISGKPDLESKDAVGIEAGLRSGSFRRQSVVDPMLQDALFASRRSTNIRDWVGKMPEATYERKMKSLMEKGTEPKIEMMRLQKPEEVLSCRYLRLSPNNIRTLLKLCKDAGMHVDIHPHMFEGEIDAKKVFARHRMVAL